VSPRSAAIRLRISSLGGGGEGAGGSLFARGYAALRATPSGSRDLPICGLVSSADRYGAGMNMDSANDELWKFYRCSASANRHRVIFAPRYFTRTSMRRLCEAGGIQRNFLPPAERSRETFRIRPRYISFANPNVKCNKGTRKVVLAAPALSPSRRASRRSGHDIAGL